MKAVWNGAVIAESEDTIVVEGNHYFDPASVKREYLVDSASRSICPWKGLARYFSVVVNGRELKDAAWYYPKPWPLARRIKGRVAFWRGVRIEQ